MADPSSDRTSPSLLNRLRHGEADQQAWAEFVRRYGRQIYNWCRRWRLQEVDAEEVTQTVLVKLVDKMRSFHYDPARSFRGYLKTLTYYAWCNFLEGSNRPDAAGGGSDAQHALYTLEAREDLVRQLHEEFDQELLQEAMERVRQRVEAHTWEAFQLTALEGLSGAEAAAQLGLKVATVFKAKSKVQQLLAEEVAAREP